jgi:probable rRNA maturation factor
MIIVDDRYGFDLDKRVLQEIKQTLTDKEIELILLSNDEIKTINSDFRGKDSATDVLSFPLEDMPHSPLGSIVISVDMVKQKALELEHSESDELTLLFIHGILHLLGYDHEVDKGEMRKLENELVEKFNLPNSLIVRNI